MERDRKKEKTKKKPEGGGSKKGAQGAAAMVAGVAGAMPVSREKVEQWVCPKEPLYPPSCLSLWSRICLFRVCRP